MLAIAALTTPGCGKKETAKKTKLDKTEHKAYQKHSSVMVKELTD